jgi:hypothetical protein
MNRTKKLISTLLPVVVLGLGTAAQAQDTPPPSEPPPPPPTTHRSSGGGDGAGIGVGAGVILSTPGALGVGQFVYDTSLFHIEGLFGFNSFEVAGGERQTDWLFGAGGWYHLHRGSSSDFSLGGVIAIDTTSGPGTSTTITYFEPGAQARVFLTSNVALFGRVGFRFQFGDTGSGTNISLLGQSTGSLGFTYFFR